MFRRKIQEELGQWATSKDRKPLVLRGARQVGKTTIVGQFAANYKQFISFNLELQSDKEAFLNISDFEGFVQSLFLMKNKSFSKRADTLLFIDEIQEVPEAFNLLRFFYERMPELSVVVAGSMLETLFCSLSKYSLVKLSLKKSFLLDFACEPVFVNQIDELTP
jgi:predicted AAA+ superfamily ATPase